MDDQFVEFTRLGKHPVHWIDAVFINIDEPTGRWLVRLLVFRILKVNQVSAIVLGGIPQSILIIGYLLMLLRLIQTYIQWHYGGREGLPGMLDETGDDLPVEQEELR